jgi:hypothetical protein
MPILLGALIGGLIGFLLRPAVPIIGQLPFEHVITAGANLSGLDVLMKGYAQTSFNYLLVGVLVGGFTSWLVWRQTAKKT